MFIHRADRPIGIRICGALLALALLFAPGLAQVTAAEICRTKCTEARQFSTVSACCAKHSSPAQSETRAAPVNEREPDQRGTDSGSKCCPGCNGRPLIVSTERLDLSLAAAPIFSFLSISMTSVSFDIPFSIFHPPRA